LSFERTEYRRLYQDIIQQILNMLDKNQLRIGDRLPSERELSDVIGVSRSTLREAFRVLEQQGIIETKPGDGRYIVGLPKENEKLSIFEDLEKIEIWDLLEARETLETKIVELACERATEEDLKSIREAEGSINGNRLGVSPEDSDLAFHLAIAAASKNVMFFSFIQINLELWAKIREKTLYMPDRVQQMVKEHRDIREAIEARDKEAAKLAQQIHLRNIRKRIEETKKNLRVAF
jgi:GntR family transcriptional repressor for pyruvate dehydrogenase complex